MTMSENEIATDVVHSCVGRLKNAPSESFIL